MAKSTTKNPKEITLYIRVDSEFKKHLETTARRNGLSVSAYARMLMIQGSGFQPNGNNGS